MGQRSTTPTAMPVSDSGAAPAATEPPKRVQTSNPVHDHSDVSGKKLLALALGAVGVVFGDIGTSPLYTIKECAHILHHGDGAISQKDILQILSLIFWSMTMVVTLKYVTFIMRADNRGEGGIMALGALLPDRFRANPRRRSP